MTGPGEPPLSLEELAGDIATLYDHLAALRRALAGTQPAGADPAHPPAGPVFRWENLTGPDRERTRDRFTTWVDTLAGRYGYEQIPGCPRWQEHDGLVEELTALWIAWTAAYTPGAHPAEPLRWHESVHRARDRLADLRGGCTPTHHHRLAPEHGTLLPPTEQTGRHEP